MQAKFRESALFTGNEGQNIHGGHNIHFCLKSDVDKIIDYYIHTNIEMGKLIVSEDFPLVDL